MSKGKAKERENKIKLLSQPKIDYANFFSNFFSTTNRNQPLRKPTQSITISRDYIPKSSARGRDHNYRHPSHHHHSRREEKKLIHTFSYILPFARSYMYVYMSMYNTYISHQINQYQYQYQYTHSIPLLLLLLSLFLSRFLTSYEKWGFGGEGGRGTA